MIAGKTNRTRVGVRSKRRCAGFALLSGVMTAWFVFSGSSPHAPAQDSPQDSEELVEVTTPSSAVSGYVDDHECVACHRDIYETYQHVGMSKSFYRWRDAERIEDLAQSHFAHAPSGRHYEIANEGDDLFITRYELDVRGERYNELTRRVDWVIGSGSHSRGYLYQNELGEMYQFPIVWYTQSRSWGMAPGYDFAQHDGFTRPIPRDCMFCHNAPPNVPAGSDRFDRPPLFPRELPEGIGCQRCHGPGEDHVRVADDYRSTTDEIRASIIRLSDLPSDLLDDVCFQCHLQPTSKLNSFERRFGRTDYSYRPGEELSEYLVHLDFGDEQSRANRFEINHHPYRLRQSTCYLASDGALNCLTCHDPHKKIAPDDRAAHYRAACFTCHVLDDCDVQRMSESARGAAGPPDTATDDCVACHMPPRRTQDVVQVVMTDHLIRRTWEPDLTRPIEETPSPPSESVSWYFPDDAADAPHADLYGAIASVRDGDFELLDDLARMIDEGPDPPMRAMIELGLGAISAGNVKVAVDALSRAVDRDPENALAATNLGIALAASGQSEQALALLERAVELDDARPEHHYNLAVMLNRIDRVVDARAHYERAIALRPTYAAVHRNLGNLLARNDEFERAASHFREALAIDPRDHELYRNLGAAFRLAGAWRDAVATWERGLLHRPDDLTLMLELAAARAVAPDESVRDAQTALALARTVEAALKNAPQPRLVQAVAFLQLNRAGEAAAAAQQARQLGADDAACTMVRALCARALDQPDIAERLFARGQDLVQTSPPPESTIDATVREWALEQWRADDRSAPSN